MTGVLQLINTGGPGGAETVYVDLVRHLDPGRWQSVTVLPNREWMYDRVTELGMEPILTRSTARVDRRYLSRLAEAIREHGVGLIHSHFFGPSITASLLGLRFGIPVVATVHGQGDLHPEERFRALKFAVLNRGVARVVFVSEPLRQAFLQVTPLRPELTCVIPNGIDTSLYTAGRDGAARAELGAGDEEFLVGAVGNLRAAKGYDVLLRAAALLREREPDYRFAIVGQAGGELYRELLALRAELGLEREVEFLGFREDVPRLMRAFDLYAITSRSEGFSLSTVQALASGLPVVATRCGGPEQILEDGTTGVLVENEAPEAVARAIAALRASAAARRRLAEAGRRMVEERFTIQAQVRAYERVYEECLERVPQRRRGPAPAGARAGA